MFNTKLTRVKMTATKLRHNLFFPATARAQAEPLVIDSKGQQSSRPLCGSLFPPRSAFFTQSSFTFSRRVESIDHSADYHTWTALKTLLQRAEGAGIHTSALSTTEDEMRKRQQKCDCSLHEDEPWKMQRRKKLPIFSFLSFFLSVSHFKKKNLFLLTMICHDSQIWNTESKVETFQSW